ncbi:ATP-dependent DNA helicase RecQ [Ahrensia sp. R2A130]|nr:ATP-dependent DNA helicase RecQ [Ahrensia sp. R2A130]
MLTKRDAEQVRSWLLSQGIDAKAYYSGIEHSDFDNSDQYRSYNFV